jgi:asparagine synthetase B (glutamine-hydrolysing)
MCGIHAVISSSQNIEANPALENRLRARGPDHVGTLDSCIKHELGLTALRLTSTVLSLRGDHIAKQPLVDDASGSVLCWNGEVWRLGEQAVDGNDTEAVFRLLLHASSQRDPDHGDDGHDPVLAALRLIQGPFAFIYLDKPAKRLYTGRDRLGRRSLLIKPGMPFVLSSIAESPTQEWTEVEADGCYTIDLDRVDEPSGLVMSRHEWVNDQDLVSIFRPPVLWL